MSATEQLDVLAINFADLGVFLDALLEIAPALDDEQCVTVRADLEQLASQVRGAIGTVDHRLLELHHAGEVVTVPGAGQAIIEAKGKSVTKGAHLARVVAARMADRAVDRETGEVLPPAALCQLVADELVVVFGLDNASASFRAGELKKRDLVRGHFEEWADGEPKVRFVPG